MRRESLGMSLLLRYRPRPNQTWLEDHRLIQVEQQPGQPDRGVENAWTLEQTVREVRPDRCRVAWRRHDQTPLDGAPESASQGEVWIDPLGRTLLEPQRWSAPLFPAHPVELDQIWTMPESEIGLPVHFRLEKLSERELSLVSYAEGTSAEAEQSVRGSVTLCRQTGRVLASTSVSRVAFPDGRVFQTVVEVTSTPEELE